MQVVSTLGRVHGCLSGEVSAHSFEHGMEVSAPGSRQDQKDTRTGILGLNLQLGHHNLGLEGLATFAQFQGLDLEVAGSKGLHIFKGNLIALGSFGQLQSQGVHLEGFHRGKLKQNKRIYLGLSLGGRMV